MVGKTRAEKWAEYRRIRGVLFSTCWDCERPCSECQFWARQTAFGKTPTGYLAKECEESYRAAMYMQRTGASFLIGSPPPEDEHNVTGREK